MKNTQVIELHYFPGVSYIKKLIQTESTLFEKHERFQKMSFRNRCMVAGSNGVIQLSIPLLHGREQRRFITEVELDNSSCWYKQHWKTLQSCYSRAPFFEYYGPDVKSMLFSGQPKLFELNLLIIEWVLKVLNINPEPGFTTSYRESYADKGITDCRNRWLPKNVDVLVSGDTPVYYQVFQDKIGFQPNLSILDLLFCEGPASLNIILADKKY